MPVQLNTRVRIKMAGDTMVEVLLCIAIAGLAVVGAYALTTRSLHEGVTATERTEANKIASAQIEALKYREVASNKATWQTNFGTIGKPAGSYIGSFCLDTSASSASDPNWGIANTKNYFTTPDDQTLNSGSPDYNPKCVVNNKYFIDMSAAYNPQQGQVYLVIVRWLSLGGGPNNQSQLYYKLPPELP